MGIVRFYLALIVLLAHAGFGLSTIGALAAVQAFFVLSGMYMAAVYTSKYSLIPKSVQFFYLNRVFRLYPTYIILTLLTAAYYLATGGWADETQNHLFDLFEKAGDVTRSELTIVWSSIILLVGQDFLSVHEPYHFMLPVRQSWSIASELLFYVTVPLLFRHMTLKRCLVGFSVLMGVKFALLRGYDWRASYFSPVGNFGYFLLGYGAYLISVHPAVEAFKTRYGVVMKRGVLLLILMMLTFFGEASFERAGYLHHFIMLGIFTAGCVLMFERAASRFDLLLGNLAYGIYLNHFLLIVVLGQVIGTSISKSGFVFCVIVTRFLMALLMEKSIQGPIDRWRRARTGFASPG